MHIYLCINYSTFKQHNCPFTFQLRKLNFLDVVDALVAFFVSMAERNTREEGGGQEEQKECWDPVIWFDLFCNCQHDTDIRQFEWWTGTFSNAIQKINNVVIVLMPWDGK